MQSTCVLYYHLWPVRFYPNVPHYLINGHDSLKTVIEHKTCFQFLQNLSEKNFSFYEGHLESKERFAIQRYLLIIGKKKKYAGFMTHLHLLLHIVTLDTEALVVP